MSSERPNHLPISSWAEDERPREKFLSRGQQALTDSELLAILITSGNRDVSAVDLAKQLLLMAGNSLNNLARLTMQDLKKTKGIGKAKALIISAALELGRRRTLEKALSRDQFTTSKDCFHLFHPLLSDLNHEEFWILLLNRNNRIIINKRVSEGGISGTMVDAKIIFKTALDYYASSLILCHNHPSHNTNPSQADVKLTRQIVAAGETLDIAVMDHIIIAGNNYFSFADEGLI